MRVFCCSLSPLRCLMNINNFRKAVWDDFFFLHVLLSLKTPYFLKHHSNCIFQDWSNWIRLHKGQMDGPCFFPLSDRLSNCRRAAVTPSQSVTATAFPAITWQEGSIAVFCQTHCQHNSCIHRLFFSLFWTPGPSFLFRFSICMCPVQGHVTETKNKQLPCGCRYW